MAEYLRVGGCVARPHVPDLVAHGVGDEFVLGPLHHVRWGLRRLAARWGPLRHPMAAREGDQGVLATATDEGSLRGDRLLNGWPSMTLSIRL